MKITSRNFALFAGLVFAGLCAVLFAFDLAWTMELIKSHGPHATGTILLASAAAFDLKSIATAIESSNTSFLDFKNAILSRMNDLETFQTKAGRPNGLFMSEKSGEGVQETKAFGKFVRSGDDIELKALAVGTNGGADGGYAVPKFIDQQIETLSQNISPIRQISSVVQVSTGDYHKLVNRRGTLSGWVGESAARPATNSPQFTDLAIPQFDLYCNLQATQQMLDDAQFNADDWIITNIAEEFARNEGAAFTSGAGPSSSQPTGFLSVPNSAVDDTAGTRPFGTLQYLPTGVSGAWPASNPADLLIKVLFSLKATYRRDAVWLMSKSTLSNITTWKDSAGRFIFNPISEPGIPAMLLGYPLIEVEDMPTVAANSISVAVGSFKRGYQIVDRIGTRVLRDPFSNKPYVGFYCVKRVGGQVVNSEAIKLIKFAVS